MASQNYNPTVFNENSDIIHDIVKLQGAQETILCLERVVGTFLIEGIDEPTTPEDIQRVADCTKISDLLGKVRESEEAKRIDMVERRISVNPLRAMGRR